MRASNMRVEVAVQWRH